MARHYVRLIRSAQPHGPYRVGGYSLGGAVALEAARQLTAEGEQVEQVLMWDTLPPHPGERARSEREFLDLYPPLLRVMFKLPSPPGGPMPSPRTVDEAIESVRPPGWPDAVVRELRTMYEVWRVCDRALAEYRPEPYDGPVHLFVAEQPLPEGPLTALTDVGPGSGTSTTDGWRGVLTGELRSTTLPGHHFDMFDAARLPVLAEAYDRALRPEAARTYGGGDAGAGAASEAGAAPGAAAGAGASTAVPATPVEPARPGGGDDRDGERRGVALLFPGQGSQFEGMGSELLARYPESAAEADEVLGYRVADVCAGDPRRPLSDTAYTQPALYVVCALALRRWREEQAEAGAAGARPVAALGHSLGEYNALEAAGVFSFADGLRLVAERGAAMAKIGGGGMIAVSGLTDEELRALLDAQGEPTRLDLAAVNAPRMHTLSGPDGALDAMSAVLLRNGARSVRRLDVGGPFHSRWMSPAAREFRTVLDGSRAEWAAPAFPVVANTTARPHSAERVREELVAQIDHPVLWSRSVEHVIAEHDDPEFHEIGGRRVLTPMVTRIRNALKGAARHG
jgi:malonyl CoA-acyl carrier protein transacylase